MFEYLENHITKIECSHFVQANKGNIFFEWGLVEQKYNFFDILGLYVLLLNQSEGLSLCLHFELIKKYQI